MAFKQLLPLNIITTARFKIYSTDVQTFPKVAVQLKWNLRLFVLLQFEFIFTSFLAFCNSPHKHQHNSIGTDSEVVPLFLDNSVAYEVWLCSLTSICAFNEVNTNAWSGSPVWPMQAPWTRNLFQGTYGEKLRPAEGFLAADCSRHYWRSHALFEPQINLFTVLHPKCSFLAGRHDAGVSMFISTLLHNINVGQFAHLCDVDSLPLLFIFTRWFPWNEL
jgi:hypothetical protein